MLTLVLAALFVRQGPITIPAFATWDGKSLAGVALGTSEGDLGKQVQKSKTVGPDPASVRIAADKKGWIVAAILTDVNNKGKVGGFTVDLERDEPIESLETLQTELGPPDYLAFAAIRYSDWCLAVWKDKGIAAVVQNGSRPLVKKILLTQPSVLNQNLDVWERDPNGIRDMPRLPVTGFEFSVSTDPQDRRIEDDASDGLRRHGRRLMDRDDGKGWMPVMDSGTRIRVSFQFTRRTSTTVSGTVSSSYRDSLGDLSFTETSLDTIDKDRNPRDRAESMFDDLMDKLAADLDKKYRRLAWQTEWRQFTGLARPKP